ncbi:hypothetical protein [Halarchaeum nitratireducens]|nr:hypothetical protein [Halarchaeum nitratireducens]
MDDDVSKGMETAYDEMSSFVERQMDVTENLDKELLTLMKYTILMIGSIYPVFNIIVAPNNQMAFVLFQPWLLLSVAVLIYSTWFSAQGYRNGIYYGGFEDSPFFNFKSVTNQTPIKGSWDVDEYEIRFPSDDEFYLRLLNDYSVGIAHNNWEINFKSQLVHHVFKLITLGVVIFVVGIIMSLFPNSGYIGGMNINTGTFLGILAIVLYQMRDSYCTYREFNNRQKIEERLTIKDFSES